jgi:hypothetical protein
MADISTSQNVVLQEVPEITQASILAGVETTGIANSDGIPNLDAPLSLLPLPQSLSFLLEHIHHTSHFVERVHTDHPLPPSNHTKLLRIAPHLASGPDVFLLNLIQAAIVSHLGSFMEQSKVGIARWLFLIEGLPLLLKWWKDNSEEGYLYPVSVIPRIRHKLM